ncbi:hypothetical protein N431DRAFT_488989 [Stipitochalara longipes BDJ]|nr:hypothetical protein N431DRAFT_488989 [Stipitochalara longipes BDJ]
MTMSGPPPPLPPSGAPPQVPEGWKAEWSGANNAWYYFNQATQTSTWENPLNKAPLPPSPPPYAPSGSNPPQSHGSLYGDDEKSTTERGLPGGLGRLFGHHSHSPPVNQNTRPTSPAFQGSAPLYIHAACWCDQDITQKVRGMVTPQQTLSIRCDALTYHFGDPMPNRRKQFSMLYSYGQQPWQLVATAEGNEAITLHPVHPIDNYRAQFVQQPNSKVVALVWGIKNALVDAENSSGRSAGLKMMEVEREGRLEASNAWMGFDGFPNNVKMAVVYYRNPDGSVSVAAAREGETLRLPWNAFAGAI